MFNCGFIFITDECNPAVDHTYIPGDSINMQVVGVSTYSEGVQAAKTLAAAGANAIELCPGFGVEGVAKIKAAVPGVPVGVVRFDFHVCMDNQSPDDLF